MCVIIPLTRNVEPLTRKGKQLTRKVGVKFYGFIFWLKRIILGKFGIKNVLPTMTNHYRKTALLHDVLRKPHGQRVSLKPKQKAKTSRFLSTLRFLFGGEGGIRTLEPLLTVTRFPIVRARPATRLLHRVKMKYAWRSLRQLLYYSMNFFVCQWVL